MATYQELLAGLAKVRQASGAPSDPASDAKWANRILAGTADFSTARARIVNEKGTLSNTYTQTYGGTTTKTDLNKQLADEMERLTGYRTVQEHHDAIGKQALGIARDTLVGMGTGSGIAGGGPKIDFARMAQALFPWLPAPLLSVFTSAYTESGGNAAYALGVMRQSSAYETHYPGNRRPDGTLRYSEEAYARQIEGYQRALAFYDLPTAAFQNRFKDLIEGGVDADAFATRLDKVYVRVFSQGDAIRQAYADYYGSSFSDAALMASAIDPSLSPSEIDLMLTRAEVGGAARESGFRIGLDEADRLTAAGLNLEAARNVARRAQGILPTLATLFERHNDPNDEFDFMDYADAVVLADPEKLRTMRRVISTEASTFSAQRLSGRDQAGRVTGLRQT